MKLDFNFSEKFLRIYKVYLILFIGTFSLNHNKITPVEGIFSLKISSPKSLSFVINILFSFSA